MSFSEPDVIVLGGGGILGEAWMASLLAGLREATDFDARRCSHYVGTSAGSIVAAGLAAGIDPRTRMDALPEQPPAAPQPDASRSLLGGALRLGRGAGAAAVAP